MSRKKTQNKTNIFLDGLRARFHLKDDDAIGAFFGVLGSTVSAWRVKNSIPERYIKFLKEKTMADEKQNVVFSYPLPADLQADIAAVIHDVTDIMFSGQQGIISALVSNVREFKRAVNTANELSECKILLTGMQGQIDELNRKVDRLTAPPISADVPAASSGNGET